MTLVAIVATPTVSDMCTSDVATARLQRMPDLKKYQQCSNVYHCSCHTQPVLDTMAVQRVRFVVNVSYTRLKIGIFSFRKNTVSHGRLGVNMSVLWHSLERTKQSYACKRNGISPPLSYMLAIN